MSEEEAAERMKVLSYLKLNPRDDEENTLTLLRAERLYEETLGPQKEQIGQAIDEFDHLMSVGNRLEIEKCRRKLNELLDDIESYDFTTLPS